MFYYTECKNQNTWSHRTTIICREIKIIFHPLGSLSGFPARVIVLWQENVRATRNASLAGDRYNGHSRKAETTFYLKTDMLLGVLLLYIYCMLVREIWINFHISWTRMLWMFYHTVFIKPGMRQIPYMMLENNFRLFVKGSKCFFGMIWNNSHAKDIPI
jgi:hypothetical protein